MQSRLALALTTLLLFTILTNAASADTDPPTWDEAREGLAGGAIGGLGLELPVGATNASIEMDVASFPQVIEVYTATWCTNCVQTEKILHQVIGQSNVVVINYHKFKFEPEDPFGSNGTDDRWESIYGGTSTTVGLSPRLAPTTVFDGERLHLGTRPKSSSISSDYNQSISVGSSHPFSGNASLSFSRSSESTSNSLDFSWNVENVFHDCVSDCQSYTLTPWLMYVEQVASFPEGSNGKGNYSNILVDTIQLPSLQGEISLTIPEAWDGDDISAILVIDWETSTPETTPDKAVPALGPSLLICLLAILVPRRNNHMPL